MQKEHSETCGSDNTAMAWPGEGWRQAFRGQATPALMARALRWAEGEGLRIPSGWDPEDVVQQILAATVAGTLRWRPELAPLGAHLRDKIRRMARVERRRYASDLWRTRATVLDVEAVEAADEADADALLVDETRDRLIRDVARRCEAQIAQLAAGDPIALRVLGAMPEAGTDAELAEAAGLTVAQVRAAKGRLRRLARKIDPHLRADAVELVAAPHAWARSLPSSDA